MQLHHGPFSIELNCFDCRKLLLAAPRERSGAIDTHVADCGACSRLASRLGELDARIAEAAAVPLPDALADRILVRRRRPHHGAWRWAAAAAVLVASAVGTAGPLWDAVTPERVAAVGPTHPAVAAINMVVEQQPSVLEHAHAVDRRAMEDGLKRLGLTLKSDLVRVDYAGKCYMPETDCEHLVLETSDGPVSVILMPDYPIDARTLVEDRRMAALVTPAGNGGYVVVAGSPTVARRADKLFVKS